jgi:hypothetical protein
VYLEYAASTAVDQFEDDEWEDTSQARLRSALASTTVGLGEGELSEVLVMVDLGLEVPEDAVITGLEVHVFRFATVENGESVVDATVRLRANGQFVGTEHGTTTPWSTTLDRRRWRRRSTADRRTCGACRR